MTAASMESCRFAARRSPRGRFWSVVDVRKRLQRVRDPLHQSIHIKQGAQPVNQLEPKSSKFWIQSYLGSPKNRRMRRCLVLPRELWIEIFGKSWSRAIERKGPCLYVCTDGSRRACGVGACACLVTTLGGPWETSGPRIDRIPPARPHGGIVGTAN